MSEPEQLDNAGAVYGASKSTRLGAKKPRPRPSKSPVYESEDFDRFSSSDVCHLFLHPITLHAHHWS